MANEPNNFQPHDPQPAGPRWEEMGDANIPLALIALRPAVPEVLFILYDPRRDRHCYRKYGDTENCGLLCFSSPEQAHRYAQSCLAPYTYDHVLYVALDAAHEMARGRHCVVNCLLVFGEAHEPTIHYVK